jgi:hypothetical protein
VIGGAVTGAGGTVLAPCATPRAVAALADLVADLVAGMNTLVPDPPVDAGP